MRSAIALEDRAGRSGRCIVASWVGEVDDVPVRRRRAVLDPRVAGDHIARLLAQRRDGRWDARPVGSLRRRPAPHVGSPADRLARRLVQQDPVVHAAQRDPPPEPLLLDRLRHDEPGERDVGVRPAGLVERLVEAEGERPLGRPVAPDPDVGPRADRDLRRHVEDREGGRGVGREAGAEAQALDRDGRARRVVARVAEVHALDEEREYVVRRREAGGRQQPAAHRSRARRSRCIRSRRRPWRWPRRRVP